jgi:hypothetical protein
MVDAQKFHRNNKKKKCKPRLEHLMGKKALDQKCKTLTPLKPPSTFNIAVWVEEVRRTL